MENLIFNFYPSFYECGRRMTTKVRHAFYDAILDYFFEGVEPSENSPACTAFLLVKPNIDNSIARKRAGRNGGLKGGLASGECKVRFSKAIAKPRQSNGKASAKVEGIGEGKGKGNTPQDPPAPTFDAHLAFDEFWAAYPSTCPRKTDKKKCGEKYARLMRAAKDPAGLHSAILGGLSAWRQCETWTRDNGQYIRAPLVWLNNENWNDTPGGDTPDGDDGSGAMSETEAVLERLRREREQERTAQ